jgi:hypothetical protein
VTLQCPSKALSPRGTSVGGVSGRAGAKAGGSLLRDDSFACRDGGRHPGFLEGGTLRGASSERRPRSVCRAAWASSRTARHADDSGCPKGAEEGNVVAHALKSACNHLTHESSSRVLVDASFARSFDPCASILTQHEASKSVHVVRCSVRHHGWANPCKREKPTLGPFEQT